MYRFMSPLFLTGALLCSALLLTGCDQSGSVVNSEVAKDLVTANEATGDEAMYGPVYPVGAISDPLVARAVESVETTGAPVVGAEIRGFLVDWVIRRAKGASAREYAVLKDGNLYHRVGGPPLGGGPIAAHMRIPPRLHESSLEARSRKAALATAHQAVTDIDPTFRSAEVVVINYLVRIYLKDRSSVDVWVGLEGNPARFTNEYKLQKADATSTPTSDATSTSNDRDSSDKLEFGPVYSVKKLADPVVEKAVQSVEITGTIVSAEIRGFLLDWTDGSIVEYAVMKDGSLYRRAGMHRPSAAFGRVPPTRLKPESSREANVRHAATAAAHDVVAKRHPYFASVDPQVYGYLVRLHRQETSHVDIWVDPDGANIFYGSLRRAVE